MGSDFHVSRLEQGENLEENQRNLLQITERFFQAIIGSSSEFPPQLRSVCHCLYQVGPHSAPPPSCSSNLSALTCVRARARAHTASPPAAAQLAAQHIISISCVSSSFVLRRFQKHHGTIDLPQCPNSFRCIRVAFRHAAGAHLLPFKMFPTTRRDVLIHIRLEPPVPTGTGGKTRFWLVKPR